MTSLRQMLAVVRRDLAAAFFSPIAIAVGVLFLAIQGLSFWAVVSVLSDPRKPAPYGAVLRTHFGGTFLFWSVLFVVCAVIAMRAIADERRSGTWEALLTTPIGEGAVVLGKWLAALGFVTLLWLPTLGYLGVLAMGLPEKTALDLGPIVSAYLGLAVLSAGFLAIGIAASAATSNQIVAAIAAWSAMMILLVCGEAESIAPGWFETHGVAASVFEHIDIRAHMDSFARGAVSLSAMVLAAGLTAVALMLAHVLCAMGRRTRKEIARRSVSFGLVVAIAIAGNILAARHPHTWDLSAANVNTLAPETRRALARIPATMDVTVIRPGASVFEPVYDQVDLILSRMAATSDRIVVRHVDPALDSERIAELSVALAIPPTDLVQGGAVVFALDGRKRAVDLLEMAAFGRDSLGAGEMSRLRAEEAFVAAILELSATTRPRICALSGHGELGFEGDEQPNLDAVARRLVGDGFRMETLRDPGGENLDACRVVVIAGPTSSLAPEEALALARYLDAGGRLLYAARSQLSGSVDPAAGLRAVLATYGIAIEKAVGVDPAARLGGDNGFDAWVAVDSYGDHPISAPFQARRQTVWTRPRVVSLAAQPPGVTAKTLVRAANGWGETNLDALATGAAPRRDPTDLPGPVSIAAAAENRASGARVVVIGSARSLSSAVVSRGYVANARFAATAVSWLAGREPEVDIGAKTPAHVRLIMTEGERRAAFGIAVFLIPLGFAGVGAGLLWRRRRRR